MACLHEKTWVPTFCNHGHCAECFKALKKEHRECNWDGSEHMSYGPASSLPGRVWIDGDTSKGTPPTT